jgi:hypothetical protein
MPIELVNVFGCAHSAPAAAVAITSKENLIVISTSELNLQNR